MLRDDNFAVKYLERALADSADEFRKACRHVMEARGGEEQFLQEQGVVRETMNHLRSQIGMPAIRPEQPWTSGA